MFIGDKAFYLALFFLIGVALASFQIDFYWVIVLIFCSIIFLFYRHRQLLSNRNYLWPAIFLPIFIFIGLFYYHFFTAWQSEKERIIFNQRIEVVGLIVERPQVELRRQNFFINLEPPFYGRVKISLPVQPIYQYGDLIRLKGKIEKNERNFNQMSFPQVELIKKNQGNALQAALFNFKSQLIGNLNRVLPPSSAALASGMIFGDRSRFQPEFEEKLIETGTLHLVALSGQHIVIIVASLQGLFLFFTSKKKSFYLTFLFILFFVLMTGAQPSAIRAALMGSLAAFSRQASRLYNPRNVIILTALIMVLFNPRFLIFDLGFQLSFLAVLGIVYLNPFLSRLIKKDGSDNFGFLNWRDNAALTLSAQAAVLPLLLLRFGQFSWFSVFPNILILPFAPAIIFGGFITAVFGFISYPLSSLFGLILNLLLIYEIGVINFFAGYF